MFFYLSFSSVLINFSFQRVRKREGNILFPCFKETKKNFNSSIFSFHSFLCVLFCAMLFCSILICVCVLCYILVIFQTYNIFKRILCLDWFLFRCCCSFYLSFHFSFCFGAFLLLFFCSLISHTF